jgi:hypothetical protein
MRPRLKELAQSSDLDAEEDDEGSCGGDSARDRTRDKGVREVTALDR